MSPQRHPQPPRSTYPHLPLHYPTRPAYCPQANRSLPRQPNDNLSKTARATFVVTETGGCTPARTQRSWCVPASSVIHKDSLMSVRDKITDAQKTTLHSNTPYITYVIHAGVGTSHCITDRAPDLNLCITDCRSPASLFRIRVSTAQPCETVSNSHHPPNPL